MKAKFVKNSIADPNREVVENWLCETHDEVMVRRPSMFPEKDVCGLIEVPKCKCGCWNE